VAFQRKRRRRNYDEGVLLEVRRPSPDRVTPDCEYFGRCGGCSLQHLAPDAQLAMKQATLLDSLARIASVAPEVLLAPVRGANWGYRRKARLAVRHVERKGRVLVGFREANPAVDMLSCATADPRSAGSSNPCPADRQALDPRPPAPGGGHGGDNATALVFRVLDPPTPAAVTNCGICCQPAFVRIYFQPGNPGPSCR
jgi:23S rRNA (uracil1939-C5)-methyltransferase